MLSIDSKYIYKSYIGNILISSNGSQLKELVFVDTNVKVDNNHDAIIDETIKWLDSYFSNVIPNIQIPIEINGTEFQKEIYKILLEIPYGQTVSYKYVKQRYLKNTGKKTMSTQAVGHAISKNKIAIIIPCHRVINKNGSIGGYAFGTELKKKLLEIEGYAFDKTK